MGFKSDIQATRITAATSNVVVAPSISLRGILVASSGGGTGTVELKTESATGTTLFFGDGDRVSLVSVLLSLPGTMLVKSLLEFPSNQFICYNTHRKWGP